MSTNYIALGKDKLDEIRSIAPDYYDKSVKEYGIENVENNLLVPFVILQEEKDVHTADNSHIDINKQDLADIYNLNIAEVRDIALVDVPNKKIGELKDIYSNMHGIFKDYVANPIRKLVGKLQGKEHTGTIPIITNHVYTQENQHGFLMDNSIKLLEVRGKHYLLALGILLTPESKSGYLTGLWKFVSPTIKKGTIVELSFVIRPAQQNNVALSSGIMNIDINQEINQVRGLYEQYQNSKLVHEQEVKDNLADNFINLLVKKQILPSGKAMDLKDSIISLSSGEISALGSIIGSIQTPKKLRPTFFKLQGAIPVDTGQKTYTQFRDELMGQEPNITAEAVFNKYTAYQSEYTKSIQLNNGILNVDASLGSDTTTSKTSEDKEIYDLLDKDEEIDEEIKSKFKDKAHKLASKLCSKFGLKLSDAATSKSEQNDGGVTSNNNTKLNSGLLSSDVEELIKKQNETIDFLVAEISTLKNGVK